jgi:hypothetical protein
MNTASGLEALSGVLGPEKYVEPYQVIHQRKKKMRVLGVELFCLAT